MLPWLSRKSGAPKNEPSNARTHSLNIPIYTCVRACARNRNQIQELNSVKKTCSKLGVSFFTFLIIYSRVMGFQTEKSTESFTGHRLEETWSLFVESRPRGFRDDQGTNFIPESSTPAPTKKLHSRGRTSSSIMPFLTWVSSGCEFSIA